MRLAGLAVKRVAADDPKLRAIEWQDNPAVSDVSVCALATALSANRHVRRIDLRSNAKVTDVGAQALRDVMAVCTGGLPAHYRC